jgi:hypothetical protein
MEIGASAKSRTTASCQSLDANMREVRRLTNLLLKIKRYERQMHTLEKTAALHDVSEKEGLSGLEQKCLKALSHSNKET